MLAQLDIGLKILQWHILLDLRRRYENVGLNHYCKFLSLKVDVN